MQLICPNFYMSMLFEVRIESIFWRKSLFLYCVSISKERRCFTLRCFKNYNNDYNYYKQCISLTCSDLSNSFCLDMFWLQIIVLITIMCVWIDSKNNYRHIKSWNFFKSTTPAQRIENKKLKSSIFRFARVCSQNLITWESQNGLIWIYFKNLYCNSKTSINNLDE